MELAEFIKAHVTEINNNDFTEVYKDAVISLDHPALTGKLTEIFLDAGIRPLEYMEAVPDRYLDESKITSVTIPDNITSIGRYAFQNCDDLRSITIPNTVTSITIPNRVTTIDRGTFCASGLTNVTIPNSVTSIEGDAFFGCSGLTSITIPASVTSIGRQAFWGCTGLTSITIPNSVTNISDWAFLNCSGLTSVTIGNGVTSIGKGAFYNCEELESVTIPDSVTSIKNSAFGGCKELKITFNGTKAQWNTIKKGPKWKYASSKFTIHCTDGDLKE